MRVLVIEDEERLADVIARGLRRESMAVDVALDGAEGLEKARFYPYDVIVLDRDLPAVHGDEVCRQLVHAGSPARILMLTAAAKLDDRVEGLEIGADDYLAKPFAFAELVARIRALGRRAGTRRPPVLARGDIELDSGRREVTRAGRPVALTRKEFGVLQVLIEAAGDVVSSEDLLQRVWDQFADPATNTVRVTMMTLRKKLGEPPAIETVIGSGYRM